MCDKISQTDSIKKNTKKSKWTNVTQYISEQIKIQQFNKLIYTSHSKS